MNETNKKRASFLVGFFAFCVVVALLGKCAGEPDVPKGDCVNPEGPWYSPQFLEENPQYASDMYLCSEYYKHKNK